MLRHATTLQRRTYSLRVETQFTDSTNIGLRPLTFYRGKNNILKGIYQEVDKSGRILEERFAQAGS
jgi:hypothetical protein